MAKLLNIGLLLDSQLRNNSDITALTGQNIFPLGVPSTDDGGDEIEYPYIIYGRTTISPEYAKHLHLSDSVLCTIDIWAKTYKEAIQIVEYARESLDLLSGNYGGVKVQDSYLQSASEAFDLPGYYGQTLLFVFK